MLDVVLYCRDRRGRLHLKEALFPSLDGLSQFLASPKGRRWEWAEVTPIAPCRTGQVGETIRYTAEKLKASIQGPPVGRDPTEN